MFMHIAFWIVKLYMILWASSPILPTLESYLHPLHLLTLNPFSSSLFYMENPSWLFAIRYVGVIWFIFMFSNFYQFDLHNQIYFFINKSMMKYLQKPDWKLDLFLFSYGFRQCMLLIFWLDV